MMSLGCFLGIILFIGFILIFDVIGISLGIPAILISLLLSAIIAFSLASALDSSIEKRSAIESIQKIMKENTSPSSSEPLPPDKRKQSKKNVFLFPCVTLCAVSVFSWFSSFHLPTDIVPNGDSTVQSTSSKASTAYSYNDYSSYQQLPTFSFETLPAFNFDDFKIPETAEIAIENTSIEFVNYPELAHRNEEVVVKIRGEPYTTYSIAVTYSSGPSTAEGLYPKESNANGYVSWIWKIGGRTSFGTYPITIEGGGVSETTYFRVTS